MTFAPASLLALRDWWVANGGVDLGIVGDAQHAATGGYHEGRDDLERAGVLATDYSVQQPRDKAGLSNAAAAIDFGKLNGSLTELQRFSVWLVGQCQAGATGWDDVREVIYSPDGSHVWRWSGVDYELREGYPNGTGQGDSSHLWHTHVSYFRDSEARDKLALVAGFFAQPDPAPEDPVTQITNAQPVSGTVTLLRNCSAFVINRNDTAPFAGGDTYPVVFRGSVGPWPDAYVATIYGELNAFQPGDVTFTPAAGVPPATITLGPGLYQVR